MRPVGRIPPSPAGVVVGVGRGRGRELSGSGGRRPVVVVVRRRERHRHGRRGWWVVVSVLRVVLRRIGVWVLGRVRCGGREDVAVGRSLLRRGRRWRLVVVAVAVAGAPTAVTLGTSSTVATRVTHPLLQIDAESLEKASKMDLEAWVHRNSKLPLLLLKARTNEPKVMEKKTHKKLLRGLQARTRRDGIGSSRNPRSMRKP